MSISSGTICPPVSLPSPSSRRIILAPPERFPIHINDQATVYHVWNIHYNVYNVTTWYTSHALLWFHLSHMAHKNHTYRLIYLYHNWWFSMAMFFTRSADWPSVKARTKRFLASDLISWDSLEMKTHCLDRRNRIVETLVTPKRGCFTSSSGVSI